MSDIHWFNVKKCRVSKHSVSFLLGDFIDVFNSLCSFFPEAERRNPIRVGKSPNL